VLAEYEFGHALGQGTFGVTSLVTCRKTAQLRACKSVSKRSLCSSQCVEDMRREVAILQHVRGQPSGGGGELLDEVTRRGGLGEVDAAEVMRQVLGALAHCHTRGVVHRDIKLENLMLTQRPEGPGTLQVKLADFGCGAFVEAGEKLSELVGTLFYMAPEVFRRCYGPEADVWSAGVVAYALVSGQLPFYGPTDRAVVQAVLRGDVDLWGGVWGSVSEECRDFVAVMLNRNPELRPSAEEMLRHPWLARHAQGAGPVVVHPKCREGCSRCQGDPSPQLVASLAPLTA